MRHFNNNLPTSESKKILLELHLPGQFPFIQGVYDILQKRPDYDVSFSLLDDEFDNLKSYLQGLGIENDLVPASRVPSLKDVDVFLSTTNWTTFLPRLDIPKIQTFHSLIYKNSIFAGQFNDFDVIFSPGQKHNDFYRNVYLKDNPGLESRQKLYDVGYPKLDEVINGKIDKKEVFGELKLPADKPTVLYAPTWDLTASLYTKGLKIISILANMDINVLVKLHPMSYRDTKHTFANGGIDWNSVLASMEKKFANVRHVLDHNVNPYLVASDLMITDASGVGVEFMCLDKPLIFIDVPEFFDQIGRGGVEDICRVGGQIIENIDDLEEAVSDNLSNPDKFGNQRREFAGKVMFNPGKGAEKTVEYIDKILSARMGRKAWNFSASHKKGLYSLVIPTYNRLSDLKECLQSIKSNTVGDYEIIVVNDGSVDGTKKYLNNVTDIKVLEFSSRRGPRAARNAGLQEARGEFIVFLDNDVILPPGWLDSLNKTLDESDSDLVGPLSNFASPGQMVPQFAVGSDMDAEYPALLDSFCLLCKRSVIEKIGGFDSDLGDEWGSEDFSLRALLAGFKTSVSRDTAIYHKGNKTLGDIGDMAEFSSMAWDMFCTKWNLANLSIIDGVPVGKILEDGKVAGEHILQNKSHVGAAKSSQILGDSFSQELEKLPDNQKEQFVLSLIAHKCSGRVLELGYKNTDLASQIAVYGLETTRVTANPETDEKGISKLFLDNLNITARPIKDITAGEHFDTCVLYFDKETDPDEIKLALEKVRNAVKSSIKIIAVCNTDYKKRPKIKKILEAFGSSRHEGYVPMPYILAEFDLTFDNDGDLIVDKKKSVSYGKISVCVVINQSYGDSIDAVTESINAVFAQSYEDVELIVCNSSKNNRITETLKPFLGRLKYIESSKDDRGLFGLALDNASGEYITYITPKDRLLPKALEIKIKALKDDPSQSAVTSDSIIYDDDYRGLRIRRFAKEMFGGKAVQDQLLGNRVNTAATLFRKKCLTKIRRESLDARDMDYGLWLQFFAESFRLKVLSIPTILHKMTDHEKKVMIRDLNELLEYCQTSIPIKEFALNEFISNYSIEVLSPARFVKGQTGQLSSGLYAFRASVLLQNGMLKKAIGDISSALKSNVKDIALRKEIEGLISFILKEAIAKDDRSLLEQISRYQLKIDRDNATAKLHLARLNLDNLLQEDIVDIRKLEKLTIEAISLHSDNKFDPYQYHAYALIAILLNESDVANKMLDKASGLGLPLPVSSSARIMAQQRSFGKIVEESSVKETITGKLRSLFREATLSLVMIVKNEEDNLARCLKSVEGVVDEIVVVDTGSTDRTKEIARQFNAKLIDYEWNNDFSEPRNISIDNATGDWIMFLDADEELVGEDKELLLSLKEDPICEGYNFIVNSFLGKQAGHDTIANVAIRMWKNRPEHRFYGSLHEQIYDSVVSTGPVKTVNVRINHYGYLQQIVVNREKSKRNLEIAIQMIQDEPENAFAHFSLGLEYARAVDYENAFKHFEEAAKLLPDHNAYFAHVLSFNRIKMLRYINRLDEALSLADEEIARYPGYTDLIYSKAMVLFGKRMYVAALQALQTLIRMETDINKYVSQSGVTTYKAYCVFGAVYEAMGDQKAAVTWYSKAFKICPGYMENTKRLVAILLKTDSEDEVKKYLDKYLPLDNPIILSDLSGILISLGHPQIALDYLKTAEAIDKKTPNLDLLLGRVHLYLQKKADALTYLSRVKETSHSYLESRVYMAYTYGLMSDKKNLMDILDYFSEIKAMKPYITIFSSLFDIDNNNETKFDETTEIIYWQILNELMKMREFECFEKALSFSKRLSLEEGLFSLNLGKLYYEDGYKELAIQQFMIALNSDYYDTESLLALGDECQEQGMLEDAANLYLSSTAMDSPLVSGYIKLAKLHIKLDQFSDARQVLQECSERFPESDIIKQSLDALENIFIETTR